MSLHRISKEEIQLLKKLLGSVDLRVPTKDRSLRVNVGALCDMALRALSKEKNPVRKLRYVNAGEVTTWQRKVCWESELPATGDCRLVWVNEGDVIELGVELKQGAKAA